LVESCNNKFVKSALSLHEYLSKNNWTGEALIGPDPGVRFNSRFGRFIKSYLSDIQWRDNSYYLQAQGYWIMLNWKLFDFLKEERFRDIAIQCSQKVFMEQKPTGYWLHPNPEWKNRIQTVEGTFGAIGLLESFAKTGIKEFLVGALKWYSFLTREVGFQKKGNMRAINYFAHLKGLMVPNNSTLVLLFLAKLSQITNDTKYLNFCQELINFIEWAQLESGELPYAIDKNKKGRIHFICYQYNAFEFLDLIEYYEITIDVRIKAILKKILKYLSHGVNDNGSVKYDCFNANAEVIYYASAYGAAYYRANQNRLGNYLNLSDKAFNYVLNEQKDDGSFIYSRKNYGFLKDTRSYSRYLSMILYHLLIRGIA
jgi:hypothetical protein